MLKKVATIFVVSIMILSMVVVPSALACSRLVYQGGLYGPITARSMDWLEDPATKLWVFPRGMERDGGAGKNSIKWTSKYGSIITSSYDAVSVDGINEKGLVANTLFLEKAEYGTVQPCKNTLSIGAWAQYVLDNYTTVAEAVKELEAEPFQIVPIGFDKLIAAGKAPASNLPPMIKGLLGTLKVSLHLSISDTTGDSAIFEYVDGKLEIHHGTQYNVLTNDPFYDTQLNFNSYWGYINGKVEEMQKKIDKLGGYDTPFPLVSFLPGSNDASSRFIRASFYLKQMNDKATDEKSWIEGRRNELAAAFGILRNVSDPLGLASLGPATTQWRAISSQNKDPKNLNYYFEYTKSPNVFWLNVSKQNFDSKTPEDTMVLNDISDLDLVGEVTEKLNSAEPFSWDVSGGIS